MIILKLGGSVITDKTKEYTFKTETMDKLAQNIKKANKQTIIVHGAGSFGHILAKKYELNQGYKRLEQIKGFSLTHEKVQALNSLVLKSLQNNDIHAVSISPHSSMTLNNHEMQKMDYKIFEEYLKKNFTPVTFGDVVLDKTLGFSICSGDLLIEVLSKYFKPEKVVFVIDEDGIYTANPKIDKKAKLNKETTVKELETLTTTADNHADVTGGMAGKIQTIKKIAKNSIETILVNGNKPDRLYKVLVGEKTISTIVTGEK
ncbi:MAG: isopentenyl phosphate kinase [Candidatus Thermoplasmatota archaeon]|nr:isopentenyl phosphate kinase [Candidatus Thermoplasmatota archaeon]